MNGTGDGAQTTVVNKHQTSTSNDQEQPHNHSETSMREARETNGATSHTRNSRSRSSKSGAEAGQQTQTISYSADKVIGNGSFGVVFQATVEGSGEVVAIKKVLQDKRFKNRELQIMRQIVKHGRHPNIVYLQHCFYSSGEKPEELYLNLVREVVSCCMQLCVSLSLRRDCSTLIHSSTLAGRSWSSSPRRSTRWPALGKRANSTSQSCR